MCPRNAAALHAFGERVGLVHFTRRWSPSSDGLFVSCVVSKRIKPPEMLGFIKPQLATLRSKAPSGRQWIHEIKYDGYGVQLHLNADGGKALTRNGLNWTKRFSTIVGAFEIPGQAIVEG